MQNFCSGAGALCYVSLIQFSATLAWCSGTSNVPTRARPGVEALDESNGREDASSHNLASSFSETDSRHNIGATLPQTSHPFSYDYWLDQPELSSMVDPHYGSEADRFWHSASTSANLPLHASSSHIRQLEMQSYLTDHTTKGTMMEDLEMFLHSDSPAHQRSNCDADWNQEEWTSLLLPSESVPEAYERNEDRLDDASLGFSYSQDTDEAIYMQSQENNSVTIDPSERNALYRFAYYSWQNKLLREQFDYIYERLSHNWPSDLPDEVRKRINRYASKWLQYNGNVVKSLLENDEATWQHFIDKWNPTVVAVEKRKQSHRLEKVRMVTMRWLDKSILSTSKNKILDRLSAHWNGCSHGLVHSRLNVYADLFGSISSPEPLLSNDKETFLNAADAIYCPSALPGQRHVNASQDDLLHQREDASVSSQPSVPRAGFLRLGAARYNSGESWMDEKTPDEIAKIQNAVRSYWVENLTKRSVNRAFLRVNSFLEKNKGYIKMIEDGDKAISWLVAKECATRPHRQLKALHPEKML